MSKYDLVDAIRVCSGIPRGESETCPPGRTTGRAASSLFTTMTMVPSCRVLSHASTTSHVRLAPILIHMHVTYWSKQALAVNGKTTALPRCNIEKSQACYGGSSGWVDYVVPLPGITLNSTPQRSPPPSHQYKCLFWLGQKHAIRRAACEQHKDCGCM